MRTAYHEQKTSFPLSSEVQSLLTRSAHFCLVEHSLDPELLLADRTANWRRGFCAGYRRSGHRQECRSAHPGRALGQLGRCDRWSFNSSTGCSGRFLSRTWPSVLGPLGSAQPMGQCQGSARKVASSHRELSVSSGALDAFSFLFAVQLTV